MNGTLLSFFFFLQIFSIYWLVIYIKDKTNLNKLPSEKQTVMFYEKLNNFKEQTVFEYFLLKKYLFELPNISKITLHNKELYYIDNKLVLKILLKDTSIIYKFKNKKLLKG